MNILTMNSSHAYSYFHGLGEVCYPPLGIGYINSALQIAGHKVDFLDVFWMKSPISEITDYIMRKHEEIEVVCISGFSDSFLFQQEISARIKKIDKEIVIISGGGLGSSLPEYLLSKTQIDIVSIGEGEESVVEIVDALEKKIELGEIKGIAYKKNETVLFTEKRDTPLNLDKISMPSYSLYKMDKYLENNKIMSLFTSRGCPYNCNYCFKISKGIRYRSIENVFNEIDFLKKNYGIEYIKIMDEDFLVDKNRAALVAKYLKKKNVKWACSARADHADYDILKILKDNDCQHISFGLESGDVSTLRRMNKKLDLNKFLKTNLICNEAGIHNSCNIIFAYIDETAESMENTLSFVKQLNMSSPPVIQWYTPYPGTPDYHKLLEEKRIDIDKLIVQLGEGRKYTQNFTKIGNYELVKYYRKFIFMQQNMYK